MKREYIRIPSPNLGRDMETLVFGETGKPVLVFPSQCGRFYDYENFNMPNELAEFIDSGKIQLYCIDAVENEAWFAENKSYQDKVKRAYEYENSVVYDVIPYILSDGHQGAGIMAHGCSYGAYHSIHFSLKYPHLFDSAIALSGCYNMAFAIENPDDAYKFSPMQYSENLNDDSIQQLKSSGLIICSGQGAWEEWTGEAIKTAENLQAKGLPVFLDLWGFDVAHDWPWWKKMVVYFMGKYDRLGCLYANHRMTPQDANKLAYNFNSI